MWKIAAITTTYNRKMKTLKSMQSLIENGYNIDFYICDDNSNDGTPEAIRSIWPNATVVNGGNLFWCKGMHKAMESAVGKQYDLYLMFNDDVVFKKDALKIMIESYKKANRECGIVGSTNDFINISLTTYGGKIKNYRDWLNPNGSLQKCDLANWNCFMIDNAVIKDVGLIDDYYAHSYGDYDYSIMMYRNNIPIYVATDYVGSCSRNSAENTFRDSKLPVLKRISNLNSPKGIHLKSGIHYYIKNFDFYSYKGLIGFLYMYLKNYIYIILGR